MNANKYLEDQPTRLALVEQSISQVNETLSRLELKIEDIRKESKSDFRWLMTTIIVLFGSPLITSVLKSAHLMQ